MRGRVGLDENWSKAGHGDAQNRRDVGVCRHDDFAKGGAFAWSLFAAIVAASAAVACFEESSAKHQRQRIQPARDADGMVRLAVPRPFGFKEGNVRTVDVVSRGDDALASRDEPGLKFRGVAQVEKGNLVSISFLLRLFGLPGRTCFRAAVTFMRTTKPDWDIVFLGTCLNLHGTASLDPRRESRDLLYAERNNGTRCFNAVMMK